MKAAILYAKQDLRYEETERPSAGAGEVIIRVRATGICGSDLPRVNGDAAHYYPIILGHEFSGTIAEVGEGVEGLSIGQRATAAPLVPCMECDDCQKGDYALCRHYKFIGSSRSGSFADLVKVPARNVVTFSDEVSFERAAFFEPATVALHGVRCADFCGGEDVAILGGGTVGLFTMQWCKILGARRVVVFDISKERLEVASELGADAVIDTTEEHALERAMDLTGGQGFPFLFETAGQNATMTSALTLAAHHGTLCFIGTSSRDLTFPWKDFEQLNRKELHLTGSWMSYSAPFPGIEWKRTAECFGSGALRTSASMVYRTFDMSQAAEAFALFLIPNEVKGKVLLTNPE